MKLQALPDDPAGVVQWLPQTRKAKCLLCDEPFEFRGCIIGGRAAFANICNICSLKWDIAKASLPAKRKQLAQELVDWIGGDIQAAIGLARDFLNIKTKQKLVQRARQPDADPD